MRSPCAIMKSSPRSPQLEKARAQQRRPNAANQSIDQSINKLIKKKKKPPGGKYGLFAIQLTLEQQWGG